jgi:plasmid stabilization system protein ParE
MQDRLRLGQFVTQRVLPSSSTLNPPSPFASASYQEVWQDGYAFQDVAKRQAANHELRDSIERMRKNLGKKEPVAAGPNSRRRSCSISCGGDFYEQDEILKVTISNVFLLILPASSTFHFNFCFSF